MKDDISIARDQLFDMRKKQIKLANQRHEMSNLTIRESVNTAGLMQELCDLVEGTREADAMELSRAKVRADIIFGVLRKTLPDLKAVESREAIEGIEGGGHVVHIDQKAYENVRAAMLKFDDC